jgi:hypothetical protein
MAKQARAIRDPVIGSLPTAEITANHIREIMRPVWLNKNETARRVRGCIEKVLDYAADSHDLSSVNPAAGPSNCAAASRGCRQRSDQKITPRFLIRR